jgi:hypothetical protein
LYKGSKWDNGSDAHHEPQCLDRRRCFNALVVWHALANPKVNSWQAFL